MRLFRNDIIPKQELTLEQSVDDYQVGKVDFLQMIENWRQLLRFHITEKRFETDLQQSLAALAREIGSFELPENVVQPVLRPAGESETESESKTKPSKQKTTQKTVNQTKLAS